MTQNYPTKNAGSRASRKHVDCAVLISRQETAWVSELNDISATGVLVKRPREWEGVMGATYVLDMLFNETLLINVEARLRRMNDLELGFSFSAIPANHEVALWEMLGGYADSREWWGDELQRSA